MMMAVAAKLKLEVLLRSFCGDFKGDSEITPRLIPFKLSLSLGYEGVWFLSRMIGQGEWASHRAKAVIGLFEFT